MIKLTDKDGKEFAINPKYIIDIWPNSNIESKSFSSIVIVNYAYREVWRYVKQSMDEILNLINLSKIGFSIPTYPLNPYPVHPYYPYMDNVETMPIQVTCNK